MKLSIYQLLNSTMKLIKEVTFIWTIVLFIIYLVKDLPFSWIPLIIHIIAKIISAILEISIDEMLEIKMPKMSKSEKSEFARRIEEAQDKFQNQNLQ